MSWRPDWATTPAFWARWCWPWMPLRERQQQQHPLQREMAIALQGQSLYFRPIAPRADIERNPAVVAHVRRNGVASVRRQQALVVHAHPKDQSQPLAVMARQCKGLLARLPNRVTELNGFVRLGEREADLAE